MNKTLFLGNLESPYIFEALNRMLYFYDNIVISDENYKILMKHHVYKWRRLYKIQTWSWNDRSADYYVREQIIKAFPYLYPDVISRDYIKVFNNEMRKQKSYGSFRLGFGVQEELFDIFVCRYVGAEEIVYFDMLPSLQLFDPVNQWEYRKRLYEFMHFENKDEYVLLEKTVSVKKYRIINKIPFYEEFWDKYGFPVCISQHIIIDK